MQHITSIPTPHITLPSQVLRIIFVFSEFDRSTAVDIHLFKPQIPEKVILCCESVSLCTCRGQSCHSSLCTRTTSTCCHLYPPGPHPDLRSLHQQARGEALIRFLISATGSYLHGHHHYSDIFGQSHWLSCAHLSWRTCKPLLLFKLVLRCSLAVFKSVLLFETQNTDC